jgi:hypothetical protein
MVLLDLCNMGKVQNYWSSEVTRVCNYDIIAALTGFNAIPIMPKKGLVVPWIFVILSVVVLLSLMLTQFSPEPNSELTICHKIFLIGQHFYICPPGIFFGVVML